MEKDKIKALDRIQQELTVIQQDLKSYQREDEIQTQVDDIQDLLNDLSFGGHLPPGSELSHATSSTKDIVFAKANIHMGWPSSEILVLNLSGKGNKSNTGLGLSIHNFIVGKYPANKFTKIAVNAIDGVYFYIYEKGQPATYKNMTPYSKEEEGAIKFRILN